MTEAVFRAKAPKHMRLLMNDFGMDAVTAAAVMGNAGHESGGLTNFQEDRPTVAGSRGGFGWFQWTGPRRREFEAYCQRNNLDPKSDKANYGFLFVELKGSEKAAVGAVKRPGTLDDKVVWFENAFERSGVKHYPSRITWARRALDAYRATPVIDEDKTPDPVVDTVHPPITQRADGDATAFVLIALIVAAVAISVAVYYLLN